MPLKTQAWVSNAATRPPHHTARTREKARRFLHSRFLTKHRAVENVLTAAQVPTIGDDHSDASEYAHLALYTGVPQPFTRTEQAGRIGDGPGVEKGAELHRENAVGVDIFVLFPIRQEVAAAERRSALPSAGGAGMPAQPEIIVTFDAQLKKIIEGHPAPCAAGAEARAHLEVKIGR